MISLFIHRREKWRIGGRGFQYREERSGDRGLKNSTIIIVCSSCQSFHLRFRPRMKMVCVAKLCEMKTFFSFQNQKYFHFLFDYHCYYCKLYVMLFKNLIICIFKKSFLWEKYDFGVGMSTPVPSSSSRFSRCKKEKKRRFNA